MADERLKPDANFKVALGGVSDDANEYIIMLRLDPVTKRLVVQATTDIGSLMFLSGYSISDKDDDASPCYYGFLERGGSWYILKETINPGNDQYRYATGSSNYATNWTNRASLSYGLFSDIF